MSFFLYNVPGRTASNVSAETTCRLASDFKNIIGTKEASGNFDQFNQILRDKPEDFMLISGDDPVALPMIAMGAVGVISVIGNALPLAIFRDDQVMPGWRFQGCSTFTFKTCRIYPLTVC